MRGSFYSVERRLQRRRSLQFFPRQSSFRIAAALAGAFLGLSTLVQADTLWQANPATAADWFTSANWTAGVPTSSTDVYINNGGTAQAASDTSLDALTLGNNPGESGTLLLTSGNFSSNTAIYQNIGNQGTGTFTQSGGSNTSGLFYLG